MKARNLHRKLRGAKNRLKESCHATHDTISHILYLHAGIPCGPRARLGDVFLHYDDVLLTNADYFALVWREWFTDNIISFHQRFLENTLLQSRRNKIVLLRPSMAQMLLLARSPRAIREALPTLREAEHVAIILNNNMDGRIPDGGSHWSLLWVSTAQRLALHYDSVPRRGNRPQAKLITKALSVVFRTEIEFVHMPDNPVQENCYDCGLRACVTLEFVIEGVFQNAELGEPDDEYSLTMKGWEIDTQLSRRELQLLIERLREEF